MKTREFTAVFYYRDGFGKLQEIHETQEAKSKAAFLRLAKATAKTNGWRLVEVYEKEAA